MSSTQQIPVIDVSGNDPSAKVAEALVGAVATYGFVFVKNDLGKDIPIEAIDSTFELVYFSQFKTLHVFLTYL